MENEIKKVSLLDKASGSLMKVGAFMGQQKHFSAIRDAFGAFLPLLIVGALAVMINSVFIESTGLLATLCGTDTNADLLANWTTASSYISPLFNGINNATMNLFSVYIAFLLGYFLMGSYGGNQLMGGLIGLAAFMVLAPMEASAGFDAAGEWNGGVGTGYLGAKGIVFAMATGLTAPMMLWKLQNVRSLQINMPEGVPPVVGASLNSLFPFIITIVTFGALQPIWNGIMMASGVDTALHINNVIYNSHYLIEMFYAVLVVPFMNLSQSLPAVILILILISMFWFFGVHGSSVMAPVVNALWTPAIVFNVSFYAAYGTAALDLDFVATTGEYVGQSINVWTEQTMNSFVFLGGSSAVLGLLIGISLFSKLPEQRAIASIATPISCFNISEPVMFGLPVVLNPVYFIPFLFGSAILGTISYVFTALGLVNPTVVLVPWTAPVYLSGFMSTLDWRSLVLTTINFAVAIGLYLPFVLIDIKNQTIAKAKEADMDVKEFKIMATEQMENEKAERKSNKSVSKLNYKVEILEGDINHIQGKIDSLAMKQAISTMKIDESKGFAEHNAGVYKNLGEMEKAAKEEAKLSKIEAKKADIIEKIEAKTAKLEAKKAEIQSEIDDINTNKVPTAQKEAEEILKIEKQKIADKRAKKLNK